MPHAAIFRLALLLMGGLSMAVMSAAADDPLSEFSLAELEQQVAAIDAELDQLAGFDMRSGAGAIGFRSNAHKDPVNTEWIRIELGREQAIDQVVLVPAISRDASNGFRADGFPPQFRILAGTKEDSKGRVIASFNTEDQLLPRIAPLVVSLAGVTASWVKVEASVLSRRAWDRLAVFQLSEMMVFSAQENVALGCRVDASSGAADLQGARHPLFLVDGFVPYLMDASHGEKSPAFVSRYDVDVQPSLVIDLETSQAVNRIHLHATELGDNVPQSDSSGYGVPGRLLVEGSNRLDFSDAVRLFEYQHQSIYDVGPIIMRRFPETSCRYVRLIALEPCRSDSLGTGLSQVGFAEIEVFSGGRNAALAKEVRGDFLVTGPERRLSALTDGRNIFGQILTTKGWMSELARRHDLERERPLIVAELDWRYARQKINLTRMGWLAGLLALGIVLTLLLSRILRLRQAVRLRERLAADLHDDLGASLHTIGLLSDLAAETKDSPQELATLHRRIRSETERTGSALRHCADRLNAKAFHTELVADMRRASRRIMAKLEHDISIEGEEFLEYLDPRTSYDLLLFYRECLINTMRHSEATRFTTRLTADRKQVHLMVGDNGTGLDGSSADEIPSSLKRRARHLGGKVSAVSPAGGGTYIDLRLKIGKRRLRLSKPEAQS